MVGSLELVHLILACGFAILTMNLVSTAPSLQHYGRYNDTPAGRYFTIDQHTHTFIKDGKPFQYISGSFHYFRIPSSYWLDRLQKAKAAGLDAIDMYVAWNVHSPEEGVYQFDGERNLEHFLELIHQLGLLAIVRVGPYICAEWSFGGLPPWLLRNDPTMKLRSSSPDYFLKVVDWFDVLFPVLRKYLYTERGPIIMVQLENEYGSAGICDQEYMSMLYDLARYHLGPDVILFTTDGASEQLLRCGSKDERYLATIDFGPTPFPPNVSFYPLEHFRPKQPLVNSELYVGWFDHWGDAHTRTSENEIISTLTKLMAYSSRVNVNMYMFHGGTSFGLWNGVTEGEPVTTSYDYDAPISEAGDITEKYKTLRTFIHKFKKIEPPPLPKNTTKAAYGTVGMVWTSHVLNALSGETLSTFPLTMEALGQYEGFTAYITALPTLGGSIIHNLTLEKFADIAHVYSSNAQFQDLRWHVSLTAKHNQADIDTSSLPQHTRLILLLENSGYVNYGKELWNGVKGLSGNVTLNGNILKSWTMMPIRNPFKLRRTYFHPFFTVRNAVVGPIQGGIFTGEFLISSSSELHDTFLQPDSFVRGIISVNENTVGRFNQKLGPQLRLYIPKQFLVTGTNKIVIMEMNGPVLTNPTVTFLTEPLWM
ncbi:hypothetical protein P879_06176 [Paragonimus westermani]|uniref:Beta-galactosidase n=1 Tax=Paragonimus westermani TaxID=34504 RepID=A0A8T0D9F6_9TREM|nr:hypothetical protein P879_06176 [Paragonimus westermani]